MSNRKNFGSGSQVEMPMSHPPVRTEESLFRIWAKDQVYLDADQDKEHKHVPKLFDWVVDRHTGTFEMVTYIDPMTDIPKLDPINVSMGKKVETILSSTDDAYRLWYDKTQMPATLTPDTFLRSYGGEATVMRIFKGTNIDDSNIISMLYDNNGEFIGHDIPMELAGKDVMTDNRTIKVPVSCHTNADLKAGDVCMLVFYGSSGKVVGRTSALIEDSAFIKPAFMETRAIKNISLKSVFLDNSDKNTVHFPLNLTIDSYQPVGVLHYNDGSTVEMIVDGSKFQLWGIDDVKAQMGGGGKPFINNFSSTTPGHKIPIMLAYKRGDDEASIMVQSQDDRMLTRPYDLIVSEPNRSYGVKLFLYPEWMNDVSGYRLKAYLMTLDRDVIYEVPTDLLVLAENSPPFDPKGYGMTQRLTYSVDLANLSATYGTYRHTQTVDIVLRAPANDAMVENIWEVTTEYPSPPPYFGTNLRARLVHNATKSITISNKFETEDEFLDALYKTTRPLVDPTSELNPPRPTHFGIENGSEELIMKLGEFKNVITFQKELELHRNVVIKFYKELADKYLKLSVCELTVRK